ITRGPFLNALLKGLVFVDVHIVSVDRALQVNDEELYVRGIRGFLKKDESGYVLSYQKSKDNWFAGVFYKEIGTYFNNSIFEYICGGETKHVHVLEDHVTESIKQKPNIQGKKEGTSSLSSHRDSKA